MKSNDISELVDAITGDALKDGIVSLKRRIDRSDIPAFIMGYCASDSETFDEVAEYLREQLTQVKKPLEITIGPYQNNLRDYFLANIGLLQSMPGEVAIVKVRGFDKIRNIGTAMNYRIGHDYDQDVCEGQKNSFKELTKKVLVVTHIDSSSKNYGPAVVSASQSQFKSFLYEFKIRGLC